MKPVKFNPDKAILAEIDQIVDTRREKIEYVVGNRQRGLMVMMENVENPFNLAAISRTCDAFGIQTVGFTVASENTFDPKAEGNPAATSASKWLDYRMFTDGTKNALETLKSEGWHIMATVAETDGQSLYELNFADYPRLAILVGNERKGLSAEAVAMADTHMTIPMLGMIRSFNVSVATAIIVSEVVRQRHTSGKPFHLTDAEAHDLKADFVRRSLNR